MSFCLYSFIIRGLYQGASYKFLQSDMRHKTVESINDIVEQGYSIYVFNEMLHVLNDVKIEESKVIPILFKEHLEIIEKLKDPSFDGVLVRAISIIQYMNRLRVYNFNFEICKQQLVITPVVLYFQKGSFLTNPFNEKLNELINAGLIEYWNNLYLQTNVEATSSGPKILTITHLIGIFQIWITGCLVAFMVFIIEVLKMKCSSNKN